MNTPLVQTLENEHKTIVSLLNEVSKVGVASPTGRDKLFKAKTLIINHLQKEERDLYPKLMADPKFAALAMTFSKEMAELSKTVIAFFDKYDDNNCDIEFARDVGRIAGALKLRITKEETQLYTAFNELSRAA